MRRAVSISFPIVILSLAIGCSGVGVGAAVAQDVYNSRAERDASVAWQRCAHSLNNAIQAFQIVDQATKACSGHGGGQASGTSGGNANGCWGPLNAALGEVQAAASLFRQVPGAGEARAEALVAAGNTHNHRAEADLNAAQECSMQGGHRTRAGPGGDQFNSGGDRGPTREKGQPQTSSLQCGANQPPFDAYDQRPWSVSECKDNYSHENEIYRSRVSQFQQQGDSATLRCEIDCGIQRGFAA